MKLDPVPGGPRWLEKVFYERSELERRLHPLSSNSSVLSAKDPACPGNTLPKPRLCWSGQHVKYWHHDEMPEAEQRRQEAVQQD